MSAYSEEARMSELLAPLHRLEPVSFAGTEEVERRPLLRRPLVVVVLVVLALAITGVAIANGVGVFNGISAAQNTPTGVSVLDRKALAEIKLQNSYAAAHSTSRFPIPRLLLNTARVLGTMPNGSKVYGLANSRGNLCLIGDTGGGCFPPLDKSHPITFMSFNRSPTTGGTFIATGVAIDGVNSVSFKVWSHEVSVPVRNNVWVYEKPHSTAHDARCIVVHFDDGSTLDYPPGPCST